MAIEVITLGGGCFWCIESALRMMKGVLSAKSGYSGGETKTPTYRDVCSGSTGHAEVVEVEFDNRIVDLETVLKAFFALHDPTTLNRQGADIGTQYRSVIFYRDDTQREVAERVIQTLSDAAIWPDPIVTELSQFDEFFEAEAYHQDYYAQNPTERYCQLVIQPKLRKFMMDHQALLT